ncbi:uncharacterized protein LOC112873574 isoform X1 [Panicum hallii]|uniref:uncharacterized protein LOC112873574 isoform X1 n=1 Tax=Panicum hallii TaxID=206008 RepID=UPI000DF4E5E1|nr:uncharacterized protein LOC112873574 isoform X1 [Panicum hallii]
MSRCAAPAPGRPPIRRRRGVPVPVPHRRRRAAAPRALGHAAVFRIYGGPCSSHLTPTSSVIMRCLVIRSPVCQAPVRDNKHRLLTSVWMASASTYPDMSSTAFTQPLQIDFMRKILGKEPRIDFRNFAPMAYVKA